LGKARRLTFPGLNTYTGHAPKRMKYLAQVSTPEL
jgi:hypothetical protein